MTKAVILAGGRGSRLQELTGETPKPMLLVGGVPILQHLVNKFYADGFCDIIIPVGYLGSHIFQYFRGNYEIVTEDENELVVCENDLNITIVNTGLETQTGGRLLRLKKFLLDAPFMVTYGDGLSKIHPKYVADLGKELNKNIVTAVHPPAKYGSMTISPSGEVQSFTEKVINPHDWINGGFFYFKPEIFQYISGDDSDLARNVLPKVVWDSGLFAFLYEGNWHCIDTIRDLQEANEKFDRGELL